MKLIGPGQLWQQVTLQNPTTPEVVDSFGQPVPNWTTVGVFSARIEPLQGREAIIARQVKAQASHKVTMWYLGPTVVINPASRLLYSDPTITPSNPRTFGVISVVNVKEREWWYEIIAQEIEQTGEE